MPKASERKDSAVEESAAVQAARVRARRRLIGAAVLVGIGIIGFPLLFETQPRPIAVDIPIDIPSKDNAPPLALPKPMPRPASQADRAVAATPGEAAPSAPAASASASAAVPKQQAAVASAPVPKQQAAAASAAVQAPKQQAAAAPAASAAVPANRPGAADVQRDAQRAQALLEGKSASAAEPAASAARFVVQAGAYTDPAALRDARQKLEKLGMKTYTQVVETDSGARTRVRVGPFATRDEAEKAAARVKAGGLAANILVL